MNGALMNPTLRRSLPSALAVVALGLLAPVHAQAASSSGLVSTTPTPSGVVPAPPVPSMPDTLPRGGVVALASAESWIVAARPGPRARALARASGARVADAELGTFVAPEARAARLVEALRDAGLFVYSEPDVRLRRAVLSLDPLVGQQWALPTLLGSLTPPDPDPRHHIAIVEAGRDGEHADTAHVTYGPSSFGRAPFISQDPETLAEDIFHGTAVASVASAPSNGTGIAGIWPGQTTRIYASDNSCSAAAAAIREAADAGAAAINLSYGATGYCFTHLVATNYAMARRSVVVASAGNYRIDPDPDTGKRQPLLQPANDLHVLTVGSVNSQLLPSGFSHQNRSLDVVAPGEGVLVASPRDLDLFDGVADGYTSADGTSFAAPYVAGAVAWLRKARPRADASRLQRLVRESARDLGRKGKDRAYGYGLMNLKGAIRRKLPWPDNFEPNDDIAWIDGRAFGSPDEPYLGGSRTRLALRGSLDRIKDPVDVVPVRVPGRSTLTVRLRGHTTNVNLEIFQNPTATTVFETKGRIARSTRRGKRREFMRVRNGSGTARIGYIAIKLHPRAKLRTNYVLDLRRSR